MGTFNIVIDDENRYFAEGLRLSIEKYAQNRNKSVNFLSPDGEGQTDMVVASSLRRAQRWRRANLLGAPFILTVKERPVLAARGISGVLYRTDNQNKLFELLSEALSCSAFPATAKRQILTGRERQVVGYLRNGFDQSHTARLLGLSVKTIHSHKRSIMRKLMLTRHHEFIYWLLLYGDEYTED
ncbi:LuxR C-terminal-related transcriptional regulator [Serratia marcescens]|uniref:helix-turn-helix transcriptional regulator n=1 Tax=Serratia marcescens TaxID=615 RepID=UPI0030D2BCBD